MKAKNKVILGSALAIAMSASMIAGTTFALFTSESSVNIAVTSAKVNVVAKVEESTLKLSSMGVEQSGNKWELGGTAGFTDESKLSLVNIAPGDKATFDITVKNNSTIDIKYIVECSASGELADALEYSVDGSSGSWAYWSVSDAAKAKTVSVSVELPEDTNDEFQEKSAEVVLTVRAVQGNATVDDGSDENTITVYTAKELVNLADTVNSGKVSYRGKTVKLMNDLDMSGIAWTPIGESANWYGTGSKYSFGGTFDGQGHTIYNLTSAPERATNTDENAADGLFGTMLGVVKNVTVENANITGTHWVGGIVGYSSTNVGMKIENCHVKNSVLTTAPVFMGEKYDNGDKIGGIIGYTVVGDTIDGCTVDHVEITGYRHIGGIAGFSTTTIKNCAVSNVTLMQSFTNGYKVMAEIAGLIGEITGNGGAAENCTAENVVIKYGFVVGTEEEFVAATFDIPENGVISLNGDFTLNKAISINVKNVTLNGNGHKITLNLGLDDQGIVFGPQGDKVYFPAGKVTVRDLNIDGTANYGLYIANYNSKASTEDEVCLVENVTITGQYKYAALCFPNNTNGLVKNCHIENNLPDSEAIYAQYGIGSMGLFCSIWGKVTLDNTKVDTFFVNNPNYNTKSPKVYLTNNSAATAFLAEKADQAFSYSVDESSTVKYYVHCQAGSLPLAIGGEHDGELIDWALLHE